MAAKTDGHAPDYGVGKVHDNVDNAAFQCSNEMSSVHIFTVLFSGLAIPEVRRLFVHTLRLE